MNCRNKLKFDCSENGFTLAEAIATLVIATMIMAAVTGIYIGIKRAEASINRRLEGGFLAMEVLQRISEDIDRLAMPGSDAAVTIKNKLDIRGYKISQMIIESKIYGKDDKPMTFEKIVWQSKVDTDANGMILYRAHSGYTLEDKMLEEPKEKFETELYIPVCSGVELFSIQPVVDGNTVDSWESQTLPPSARISISFSPRQQDALGNMTVPPELVKTRTVVINRFKQIPYAFIEPNDANLISDINDVNLPAEPNKAVDVNNARRKR
jgi:hypothetical protein